jgi:hypothetical protein
VIKKVRQDTEESDEEGYFEKIDPAEEVEVDEEKPSATKGKATKKKGVQFTPVPLAVEEEEQAEFPEELPNQFGFNSFAKFGGDART